MNGCCYDLFMSPFEAVALRQARSELIAPLSGRILEIGSGTGANFRLYQEPALVTAVEPDPEMMKRAESLRPPGLDLKTCRAEELPLGDGCFDHVVSTLVFCSLSDVGRAVDEIVRVCKPGARLHLLEHVKGKGLPGRLHTLCTPVWSKICGGCHLDRETLTDLVRFGFELEEERVVLNFLGTPFVFSRMKVPA